MSPLVRDTGVALPVKPKALHRAHIKKKIDEAANVPLFYIVAGMGSGKTSEVRSYFRKKRRAKYLWFMFEKEITEDIWEWVRFCNTVERMNSDLGRKFLQHGLPHGKNDVDRLERLIRNSLESETYVIIDDMQYCKNELLYKLIGELASRKIDGLHLICISDGEPPLDYSGLLKSGNMTIMNQTYFEFSKLEIENFYILNDDRLSEQELEWIFNRTRGWTAEVLMSWIYHRQHGSFEGMPEDMDLMRETIYNNFSDDVKQMLLRLSPLATFSMDEAEYVVHDNRIREVLRHLYEGNYFTKYDMNAERYGFHHMLRALLADEREKSGIGLKELYERIGNWDNLMGDRLGALSAYLKSGNYSRILQIMSERHAATLMNYGSGVITEAFEAMDMQTKLSNPIAYLTFIYSYSLNVDMNKGREMLKEAKRYYANSRMDLMEKNQILGEIALIESISAFNDLEAMFHCYERASDYFDGGTSRIFDSGVIITFGVPLTISLHHRRKGDVRGLVKLVGDEIDIFNHIANGCGVGYDLHMKAEAEYMAGNLEVAENLAYKALYRAQTKDQTGIILSTYFMLLRIAIFNGRIHDIDDILLKLMREVENTDNPIFMSCYEIIIGYMYAFMGRTDYIPRWLRNVHPEQTKLMSPARDSAYLISAKIALELGEFERLGELCRQRLSTPGLEEKAMSIMVFNMYLAISEFKLGNTRTAREHMGVALEYAEADDLYVILSENVYTVPELMESIGTEYALKTLPLAAKYAETKRLYSDSSQVNTMPLTKREREVMDLVCEGYTAEAIAKILFVSHSTVKKHMASAYNKLDVNKKSDAIQAYKQMTERFGRY